MDRPAERGQISTPVAHDILAALERILDPAALGCSYHFRLSVLGDSAVPYAHCPEAAALRYELESSDMAYTLEDCFHESGRMNPQDRQHFLDGYRQRQVERRRPRVQQAETTGYRLHPGQAHAWSAQRPGRGVGTFFNWGRRHRPLPPVQSGQILLLD